MIRSKNKIYGEVNDENTVLVNNDLVIGKYIIGDGNKNIKTFNPGAKRIITTNIDGKASSLSYNKANQLIGVDSTGKLSLFPRLPDIVPIGREVVVELEGSPNPTNTLNVKYIILPGMNWYEIEVMGAGGGGGAGIGKEAPSDINIIAGTTGGAGGYYKGIFSLLTAGYALLAVGNGGGGGNGIKWVFDTTLPLSPIGTNYASAGGRTPLLLATTGNDGENPSFSASGGITDNLNLGGVGAASGAAGGTTYISLTDAISVVGAGGGGGGANGPYGGAGGNSTYTDNGGLENCSSGGGGGAGGGTGVGGIGGHMYSLIQPTYGGGGGGSGAGGLVEGSLTDFTKSGGGGGGGGATIFACGDIEIICGGGGGGAGGGYGGTKESSDGQPGTNNKTVIVGGGSPGGTRGVGCNISKPVPTDCKGGNGLPGKITIWRCT